MLSKREAKARIQEGLDEMEGEAAELRDQRDRIQRGKRKGRKLVQSCVVGLLGAYPKDVEKAILARVENVQRRQQ